MQLIILGIAIFVLSMIGGRFSSRIEDTRAIRSGRIAAGGLVGLGLASALFTIFSGIHEPEVLILRLCASTALIFLGWVGAMILAGIADILDRMGQLRRKLD
ncbi:MAG: hypothetical protein GVY24_06850 [Planctomycetes bacterium]|jgi:cytochrome c biogenesis protein CcdA|nr:hypothetical protein [Planctomycetota bacterium]